MTFAVYLITDPAYDVLRLTRQALSSVQPGRVAVQLRDKTCSQSALRETATELRDVCKAYGAPMLVNGDCELAAELGIGVHLPEAGISVVEARRRLGEDALIGTSRHGPATDELAPSFVTLSPVGTVPGKGIPLGLTGFARLARSYRVPTYALGGVDATLAPDLIEAGAQGVAAIRAIFAAPDPARALSELVAAVESARP